jgi:molybdate transport system substrate-binding protein
MRNQSGKFFVLFFCLFIQQGVFAKNITVYAAASLSESVSTLVDIYNKQHDVKITTVFAASSTLARQIARGAPADIFISANQKWMQYLVDQKKATKDNTVNILQNSLVIAAPENSTIKKFTLSPQTNLSDLIGKGRLSTGNVDHVPVGIYAKQALTALGLWDSVKSKLALSSNTRAALAFIERKAVPLGIVYKTDAQASKKVITLAAIPQDSHNQILYPLALIQRTGNTSSKALSVFQYFQSEPALAIFQQFGFETVKNVN